MVAVGGPDFIQLDFAHAGHTPRPLFRRLFERIGSPDKELVIYPGFYHELFNEPEKRDVFERVSEWLENRIKEGTVEGLRAAIQVDPANARVTAYLGRCLADYALEQGSDPDEARWCGTNIPAGSEDTCRDAPGRAGGTPGTA
jgi:hypothetical protein